MDRSKNSGDNRTAVQLRHHYDVERELAARLRTASKVERRHLYTSLYNELCRRVPDHPLLSRKLSKGETDRAISAQSKFIEKFIHTGSTYLEVGPGDCSLAIYLANSVRRVYAIDVSDEIVKGINPPLNFEFILSDGTSIPVPPAVVDVAYSNQLMEHLHPDDALEQLENVYRALAQRGAYICITPNRLNGPHDISRYFDDIATGFHLKEYTSSELRRLFKSVGFSHVMYYVGVRGRFIKLPVFVIDGYESALGSLPDRVRKAIVRHRVFSLLLDIRLVAVK